MSGIRNQTAQGLAAVPAGQLSSNYPQDHALTQDRIDSNTIHEGGHTYSQEVWKDPRNQTDWEDAIKADVQVPSESAESASTEDSSKSRVMYSLAKGTPCEAAACATRCQG